MFDEINFVNLVVCDTNRPNYIGNWESPKMLRMNKLQWLQMIWFVDAVETLRKKSRLKWPKIKSCKLDWMNVWLDWQKLRRKRDNSQALNSKGRCFFHESNILVSILIPLLLIFIYISIHECIYIYVTKWNTKKLTYCMSFFWITQQCPRRRDQEEKGHNRRRRRIRS